MGIRLRFGVGPIRFSLPLEGGRRRRPGSTYFTHAGCSVRHRSQHAAQACRVGRAVPMPRPASDAALRTQLALAQARAATAEAEVKQLKSPTSRPLRPPLATSLPPSIASLLAQPGAAQELHPKWQSRPNSETEGSYTARGLWGVKKRNRSVGT